MMQFGIDLGNGYAKAFHFSNGRMIPLLSGSYGVTGMPTDAVLGDTAAGEAEVIVGNPRIIRRNPEYTVSTFKRAMMAGPTVRRIRGSVSREVSSDLICTEIVNALLRACEKELSMLEDPDPSEMGVGVICCIPSEFVKHPDLMERVRKAVSGAATPDGKHLAVRGLIPEPAAAAASCLWQMRKSLQAEENTVALVVDIGKGTTDIAVTKAGVRLEESLLYFHEGIPDVGGIDIDNLFEEDILQSLKEEGYSPSNAIEAAVLRDKIVEAKEELSNQDSFELITPVGTDGRIRTLELSRGRLEELITDNIREVIALSEEVMQRAHDENIGISFICLTGGVSRMPVVKRLFEEMVAKNDYRGIDGEPLAVILHDPVFAVAKGAAIAADGFRRDTANNNLHQKSSCNYGTVGWEGGEVVNIRVPYGTPLPAESSSFPVKRVGNRLEISVVIDKAAAQAGLLENSRGEYDKFSEIRRFYFDAAGGNALLKVDESSAITVELRTGNGQLLVESTNTTKVRR